MKSFAFLLVFASMLVFSATIATAATPKNDIISADELKVLIDSNDKDLVIIGVLDPRLALIPLNLVGSPIQNSLAVWRGDYSGKGSKTTISPEVGGVRKSDKDIDALLSKAGATPKSKIVIYSANAMHDAARFYWQIKLLGHKDVKYLDGGLNFWKSKDYPTGKFIRLTEQTAKTSYVTKKDIAKTLEAQITDVIKALKNPKEWVVIDNRTDDEFAGKKTASSAGAFGLGTIKNAIHINWTDAVDPKTQLLKSREELQKLYGDTIKGKKVITYCQSGVRSAHAYLVLTEILGAKEVYNYDGSWIEWSFVASDFSNGKVDEKIKEDVRNLTVNWQDNGKEIN